MKQTLLIGSVVVLFCFAGHAVAQDVQQRVEIPVYQNGDFWRFRLSRRDWLSYDSRRLVDGEYEVRYLNGGLRYYWVGDGRTERVTAADGVSLSQLGRMIAPTGRRQNTFLQFPLFVGKEWSGEYKVVDLIANRFPASVTIRRTWESRVLGVEEVVTSAGAFRAFKVEREDYVTRRYVWVFTYFYSPEAKSIVKYYFDGSNRGQDSGGKTEMELIQFGITK